MRGGLIAWLVGPMAACVGVAEHRVDPIAPDAGVAAPPRAPVARRPGGAVRVTVRGHPSYGELVGVWSHREDGQIERLELRSDRRFDWSIDRGGTVCRIAGTVVLGVVVPRVDAPDDDDARASGDHAPAAGPALTWTMEVNTCNGSYQGRAASDMIVRNDDGHLVLKDAEFQLEPVPYTRDR